MPKKMYKRSHDTCRWSMPWEAFPPADLAQTSLARDPPNTIQAGLPFRSLLDANEPPSASSERRSRADKNKPRRGCQSSPRTFPSAYDECRISVASPVFSGPDARLCVQTNDAAAHCRSQIHHRGRSAGRDAETPSWSRSVSPYRTRPRAWSPSRDPRCEQHLQC